jgi:hypothetical protein
MGLRDKFKKATRIDLKKAVGAITNPVGFATKELLPTEAALALDPTSVLLSEAAETGAESLGGLGDFFDTEQFDVTSTAEQTAGFTPEQIAALEAIGATGTGLLTAGGGRALDVGIDPNIAAAQRAAQQIQTTQPGQQAAALALKDALGQQADVSALQPFLQQGAGADISGLTGGQFTAATNPILQAFQQEAQRAVLQSAAGANVAGAFGGSDDLNLRARVAGELASRSALPLFQAQIQQEQFGAGLGEQARQADEARRLAAAQQAASLVGAQQGRQLQAAGQFADIGAQTFGQDIAKTQLLGQTGAAQQAAATQQALAPFQQFQAVAPTLQATPAAGPVTTTQTTPQFRNRGLEAIEAGTGILQGVGSVFG